MLTANPNVNTLKRRRRGEVAGRGHKPSLRTPPLRPLVEYGEEDDEDGVESKQMQQEGTAGDARLAPSPVPNTAKLGGSPPKRVSKEVEDEEDAVLESLVRGRTPSPSPSPRPEPTLSPPPARLGEKRRRGDGDDDDDELLSRLTRQKKQQLTALASKQQHQQQQKTGVAVDSVSAGTRQKNGDDPPKKIKVKIGGFGNVFAGVKAALGVETVNTPSPTTIPPAANKNHIASSKPVSPSLHSPTPILGAFPPPSDSGIKDGDTG